jgi:glucose-6-phosphate 1-dehydrogenase
MVYNYMDSMMTPFVLVIFGATGDLTNVKLMPSLFNLFKQGILPQDFFIFGFSRREISNSEFHDLFSGYTDDPLWQDFAKHIHYQAGKFEEEAGYRELIQKLTKVDEEMGACVTRLFYLATPPDNYEAILDKLNSTKLAEGCGQGSSKWTKIIIEKPFGRDLETAIHLDQKLGEIFEERQIFRVDHYLGKENVQNMIAFRFANSIFDPVWNSEYVDHVQITFSESEGVGKRGKFFDGVGILRDVGQNHLMQLVAAVAMDQPRSFTKEDVRDARTTAIQSIEYIQPEMVATNVIRAQYKSYKEEKNVEPSSQTETYVAMKFEVNNKRFANTPFYIRMGKKMPKEIMEISIVFRQTCHILFKEYGCPEIGNVLTIRIQPDEGISMRFIAKKPGNKLALEPVEMKFSYQEGFGSRGTDAYEKILLDILHGDQMLFNRTDELRSSWEFITNILKGWEKSNPPLYIYDDGTEGPKEAKELIEKDGRHWL